MEFSRLWPDPPGSSTRSEIRAAATDLLFIPRVLGLIAQSREEAELCPEDGRLSIIAGEQAWNVKAVVDTLFAALREGK